MAKAVTLDQATAWIKANEHRTWSHRGFRSNIVEGEPFDPTFKASMEVKYFYMSFDTRDQKVFSITTNREDVFGNHTDDHDTILTALEARLNGTKVERA